MSRSQRGVARLPSTGLDARGNQEFAQHALARDAGRMRGGVHLEHRRSWCWLDVSSPYAAAPRARDRRIASTSVARTKILVGPGSVGSLPALAQA